MESIPHMKPPWDDGSGPDYSSPYQDLATAIVLLAVRDYKKTLRAIWKNPESETERRKLFEQKAKLEEFFYSDDYWMYQLMKLGFPVLCIDRFSQIQPCIEAILNWTPGEPFPEGIGAKIPELEMAQLPDHQKDMDDYGDTLELEDPAVLADFYELDKE